jgi:myo-inositol-1-phosphate synthase
MIQIIFLLTINDNFVKIFSMNKKLNYAEKIIGKFGGQSSLAHLMGKRQSTIQHWVETGRIPSQWQQPLMKLARDKGISLEAKDFVASEIPAVAPAEGKLGVLCVGLGAVTSTLIAGVEHVRRGTGKPFGSLTQMATIRLGKRTENNSPLIRDFVPLASLEQLVFGAWDPIPDDAYQAAVKCEVLDRTRLIEPIADFLKSIKPMPAVFDPLFCKRIKGKNIKKAKTKYELVEALREDIRRFKKTNKCSRLVMIWLASTEKFITESDVHKNLANFVKGLKNNDERIAPSQMYAYAALLEGVPFANGAPGLTVDIPVIEELAKEKGVPIAGKDMKTGQTMVKTVIAPMLKARMLGLDGWFSTNILGNRDGEVLDEPENFKTKEESKLGSLEYIFQPDMYPDLYGNAFHKVRIEYYPPRGDNKEGWDNIDLFGWLGRRMQLKINFLCSDSTLAAPVALDILLFMDLAKRAGLSGIQEWLSFYFKSPHHARIVNPEHDLFIQQTKLKNTLRWMMGADQITHLGMEYYREE